MSISVFITYCWENEEHDNKVLQLTNHLRQKGFNAEIDKLKSQEETAIDFVKMMNEAMTSYNKVIVVLSENYKTKAEMFKGGVGMEYNLIIKDISDHPTKYILVSFQGISNEIVPLSLKGREIVDLSKGDSELEKLYRKLLGKGALKFADVGEMLLELEQTEITDLKFENQKGIEFEKIVEQFLGDSMQFGKYKSCQRRIKLSLKNNSGKTLDGCQIDLNLNPIFLYTDFYEPSSKNNLSTSITKKIFANQNIETESFEIKITENNYVEAGRSTISCKVFSDIGETFFEVPILDCITIEKYSTKTRIELDDFLEPF